VEAQPQLIVVGEEMGCTMQVKEFSKAANLQYKKKEGLSFLFLVLINILSSPR
jgi:hypothetical protein